MNENDKAAIAARIWEPGSFCDERNCMPLNLKSHWCQKPGGASLAGAWCESEHTGDHLLPAPDMHDPANLWRSLENRNADVVPGFTINGGEGTWSVELYLGHSVQLAEGRLGARLIKIERPTLAEAVFTALVALYNAEHPEEK